MRCNGARLTADVLTFLSSPATLGAKTFTPSDVLDYACGAGPFRVIRIVVNTPADLLEALSHCPSDAFMVRGTTLAEGATSIPYRQSKTKPNSAPTLGNASHFVLPIDIDSKDGPLSALNGSDLERCAYAARAELPASFHAAGCIAQATSSAGVKPGARVRLWFWCNREISDAEAQVWLANGVADLSIYRAAQPIYIAPPRFDGVPNPYEGASRFCVLPGSVVVPPADLRAAERDLTPTGPQREVADADRQFTEGGLLAWEHDCATRDTKPGGSHREWYNGAVFALGTRAWMCPEIDWTARIEGGIRRWKQRQIFAGQADPVSIDELVQRALGALQDGFSQPWIPTEDVPPGAAGNAPPPKPNAKAGEKALKKEAKRLKEGLGSVPTAIENLAKHVAAGSISPHQVGLVLSDAARDPVTGLQAFVAPAQIAQEVQSKAAELGPAALAIVPLSNAEIAARMMLSEDGHPIMCPENLRVLLTESPGLRLWFDERAQQDYWDVCPWKSPGPVTQHDATAFRYYISRLLGWHKCPVEPLEAFGESAMHRPYDPWLAWLQGLQWDGIRRLGRAPVHMLGCEPTPCNRLTFIWWMVSAVARSIEPGCQVDHVLVLEGMQGERKTGFLRELAMHPRFFTRFAQSSGDLFSPRSIGKIHGPVIVELAELAATQNRDVESIKAFIDERVDRIQWLYSRKPVDVPRSCVFAATTNNAEYLRDQTGNRRFWPIKCGTINLDLVRAHRDQLWAEAVVLYKRGVQWWPKSRAQMEAIGLLEAQAEREETPAAAEPLAAKLRSGTIKPGTNPLTQTTWGPDQIDSAGRLRRVTIAQAGELLSLHPVKDRKMIVAALSSLGFVQESRAKSIGGVRFWVHPNGYDVPAHLQSTQHGAHTAQRSN